MRKPRPFSLSPVYSDDRRARLADVERRARLELGLDAGPAPARLSFRRPARRSRLSSAQLLFLAGLLLFVCWLLLQ